MTRRLQDCGWCGGRTRHADKRCSSCRQIFTGQVPPHLGLFAREAMRAAADMGKSMRQLGIALRDMPPLPPISWRGRGG